MLSRLPLWMRYVLLGLAIAVLVVMATLLFNWQPIAGWAFVGVIVALLAGAAFITVPPLVKMYRFQKYFKAHQAELNVLPSLMQTGRTQEALTRFESVMKTAPDSAYIFFLRANFLQAAGKLPEALTATNRALSLADRDPFLLPSLQQADGMMGQPTTVAGFKAQLAEMRDALEPRVSQMRERRERAISKRDRKKKSR